MKINITFFQSLKYLSVITIIIALLGVPVFWGYHSVNNSLYNPLFLIGKPANFLWDLSWWSVVFVMGIRPLADLFPKLKVLRKLNYLRRAFGILSASVVVTIMIGNFVGNPSLIAQYFSLAKWDWYQGFFARMAEITGIILLFTSNNLSQKILKKWWKRVQSLSYLYFISGGIIAGMYFPVKTYISMGIVILLWILAKIGLKIWK